MSARTGSAFGVGTYFKEEQVRVSGPSTAFVRDGQDGQKLRAHFCPTCGSTVHWYADIRPGHINIALGAFSTHTFRHPSDRCGRSRKHDWL